VTAVPDDERTRRRLGDETKGRIADLASGWTVEPVQDAGPPTSTPDPLSARSAAIPTGTQKAQVVAPPLPPPPEPRKKAKTLPPPPPGSSARKALEDKIIESTSVTLTPASSGTLRTSQPSLTAPLRPSAEPAQPRTSLPTAPPPARSGSTTVPPPARSGSPTIPPPAARSGPTTLPPPARSGPPTSPPPIPPPRPKAPTGSVPAIKDASSGKIGSQSGSVSALKLPLPANPPAVAPAVAPAGSAASGPTRLPRAQAVVVDDESAETLAEYSPAIHPDKLAVPVGEFDHGPTVFEKDKQRIAHSQATIKRDVASSLLGIAEAPLTEIKPVPVEVLLTESAEHMRGDPTSHDSSTSRFERGDPTLLGRSDETAASTAPAAVHSAAGRLRTVAALRRQRGLFGDVRYVATALLGIRRSRRELEALEAKQATRQQSRRRHLMTLGRTAVISEGFDHPAVGRSREQLGTVEEERSRHTGQVAAADQELNRVHRDRETAAKQYATDIASVDAELAELAKRYEPLLKEQAVVTKRGAALRDSLRQLDQKIASTTAMLVTVKGPRQDPAAIQAELATVKADRIAVQRDEPKIAGELDALNPRIAAIEAKRAESQKRRAELVTKEQDDQRRTEELLEAIGAKRKVMDRAASDAEALRDKILFELGERLYVDRPDNLGAQLAPIDAIDMELGTWDRRLMELREIMSSIDRAKLWRGISVIVLAVLAVAALTTWLVYLLV
jgi:hypothetical protein